MDYTEYDQSLTFVSYIRSTKYYNVSLFYNNDLCTFLFLELDDCCVFLYRLEGMYESAVKVALQLNLDLAKECARELTQDSKGLSLMDLEGSENVAKHVWLTIARHMIDKKLETSDVLKLIEESTNVVTVGDLLPLFPEFTDIEALKKPLCGCLRNTSDKINQLKQDIRETAEVMDALKKDLEEKERYFSRIKPSGKCNVCGDIIIKKSLIVFPCGHSVHTDCFEKCVIEKVENMRTSQFKILQKEYKKAESEYVLKNSRTIKEKMNFLKNKMGKVIGQDCPLCGNLVVDLIDKPFFTEEQYKNEMKNWII